MLKFNLFENGVDSLKHGIEHFIKSEYKYAILHIFHAIELLLKDALRKIHPVLIYKDIDKKVKEESLTVGFDSLIIRLENFELIQRAEIASLKKLQEYRNRIEHKEIKLDKEKAEDMLGGSLKFISKFSEEKLGVDLKDYVGKSNWEEIEEIIYSYDERLKIAKEKVDEALPMGKEALISGVEVLDCPYCGNETVVYDGESEETECFFCHEKVYIFTCDRCSTSYALMEEREEQPCDACWESIMRED